MVVMKFLAGVMIEIGPVVSQAPKQAYCQMAQMRQMAAFVLAELRSYLQRFLRSLLQAVGMDRLVAYPLLARSLASGGR